MRAVLKMKMICIALTKITLLRTLVTLVSKPKLVPNAADGISKETLFLSNIGVSSVVVLVSLCAQSVYDKSDLYSYAIARLCVSSLELKKYHVRKLHRT